MRSPWVSFLMLAICVTAAPLNGTSSVPPSDTSKIQCPVDVIGLPTNQNNEFQQSITLGCMPKAEEQLATLKRFAQYSAAAYCPENELEEIAPVTCCENVCPLLEDDEVYIVYAITVDTKSDARGFIGIDDVNKQIVLAFRGTWSFRNYFYDLLMWRNSVNEICKDCSVHHGFKSVWENNKDQMMKVLLEYIGKYPDYQVIATGHSLGGAVATIAGAELRSSGYSVNIYTYGTPRVGNIAFAQFLTASPDVTLRVTHIWDLIPKVPAMFLGYHHSSPEYWLSTGDSMTSEYEVEDIVICFGVDNGDCNAGTEFLLDGFAHYFYFGHVCGCPLAQFLRPYLEDNPP